MVAPPTTRVPGWGASLNQPTRAAHVAVARTGRVEGDAYTQPLNHWDLLGVGIQCFSLVFSTVSRILMRTSEGLFTPLEFMRSQFVDTSLQCWPSAHTRPAPAAHMPFAHGDTARTASRAAGRKPARRATAPQAAAGRHGRRSHAALALAAAVASLTHAVCAAVAW